MVLNGLKPHVGQEEPLRMIPTGFTGSSAKNALIRSCPELLLSA